MLEAIFCIVLIGCQGSLGANWPTVNYQLLPPPRAGYSTNYFAAIGFDYDAGAFPSRKFWKLGLAATNSTGQGVLLTSQPPGLAQGSLTSLAKTTAENWRIEFTIKLNYTQNSGNCPLLGYLLHDVSAFSLQTNGTLSNFKGLAVWLQVCPFGNVTTTFNSSNAAVYNPFAVSSSVSSFASCSKCTLPATVPDSATFVVQASFERLTVAVLHSGVPLADVCTSYVAINSYINWARTNPLSVAFLALNNGYDADITLSRLAFWSLNYVYRTNIPFTTPNIYALLGFPTQKPYVSISDSTISFNSSTMLSPDFAYQFYNSAAISSGNMVLVNGNATEGSIIVNSTVPGGTKSLRVEITFTASSLSPITNYPNYLTFIVQDKNYLPLSAAMLSGAAKIPTFRGMILQFGIGSSPNNSLYFSADAISNYTVDSSKQVCSQCASCTESGYSSSTVTGGTTDLGIQVVDDKLTFVFQSTLLPVDIFCYSNVPLPGFGDMLAEGNSSIQVMQQGKNVQVKISAFRFWEITLPDVPIVTTTTQATTTETTTTETTTLPESTTETTTFFNASTLPINDSTLANSGNQTGTTPATTQATASASAQGGSSGATTTAVGVLVTGSSNNVALTSTKSQVASTTTTHNGSNAMTSGGLNGTTAATGTTTAMKSRTTTFAAQTTANSVDSGFPIPNLIDGNGVPLVLLEQILKCPFVHPDVRAPDNSKTTDIYMAMTIDRLLKIDDLDETISVTASLNLQWGVFVCAANYTAPEVEDQERIIVVNTSRIWRPTLVFADSYDGGYLPELQYSRDMQIMYIPTRPNRTLYFYLTMTGVFKQRCTLNLRKFPFDRQTCDFTFFMKESSDFLNVAGTYLHEQDIGLSSQWVLLHSNETTGITESLLAKYLNSSYAAFRLTFVRNPNFQVYNLVAPSLVLMSIVFGAFLMPPDKIDRPSICATVVLAYVVSFSSVLNEVPKTSQSILLSEYLFSFTALTGLVTLYNMAASYLKFGIKFKNKTGINLDSVVFIFSFTIFICIHFYALIVVTCF